MPNYLNYPSVMPQYNRMKAGLAQTARGVTNESVRAAGSNLAARGLSGVPGASADIAARHNRTMLGSLLPQYANIDQKAVEEDARRREHVEQLQYVERMRKKAESDAERQFWWQTGLDIAGVIASIATMNPAPMAGAQAAKKFIRV